MGLQIEYSKCSRGKISLQQKLLQSPQLYCSNIIGFFYVMDKFLERHKVLKHTQEELKIGLFSLSIELNFQLKRFSQRKLKGHIISMLNSTTHLRKKKYLFYTNYPRKLKRKKHYQNKTKKKLQTNIPHKYRCKNS